MAAESASGASTRQKITGGLGPIGGDVSEAGTGSQELARAWALLDLRRPEAAVEAAGRGLASDPSNADLHLVRARALRKLGRLVEGRAAVLNALAAAPNSCDAHTLMGEVLLDEQNLPMARRALEHALTLDPGDRGARILLVHCLGRLDDHDAAGAAARQLVAEAPDSASSHVALALAELGRVRTLRLRSVLLLVVLVLVTRGLALVGLGGWWLFHRVRARGPLRRADQALHEALRLEPQDATVLELASHVLARRGHRLLALDRTVRAVRADASAVDVDVRDLRRRLQRQQVFVEVRLLVAVAVLWALAGSAGQVAGVVGLTLSGAGALVFAVWRRLRLRRILPRSLWLSSAGRGWSAWVGPVLLVAATAFSLSPR